MEEDLVTKYTKVISRDDGTEVKLVAQAFFGAGLHRSVNVDVFRRASSQDSWHLCSDQPHPDWRTMSLEQYSRMGRSERLRTATHGEILAAASMIGKPRSAMPAGTALM